MLINIKELWHSNEYGWPSWTKWIWFFLVQYLYCLCCVVGILEIVGISFVGYFFFLFWIFIWTMYWRRITWTIFIILLFFYFWLFSSSSILCNIYYTKIIFIKCWNGLLLMNLKNEIGLRTWENRELNYWVWKYCWFSSEFCCYLL